MRIFWAVLEWIGTATLRSLGWLADQLGQATVALAREIARWARRTCFGTWRRTAASSGCAALVAAHYYPAEVWPLLAPLLTIAVTLFGIRVMFHPYWPMGGRRRRRRRD